MESQCECIALWDTVFHAMSSGCIRHMVSDSKSLMQTIQEIHTIYTMHTIKINQHSFSNIPASPSVPLSDYSLLYSISLPVFIDLWPRDSQQDGWHSASIMAAVSCPILPVLSVTLRSGSARELRDTDRQKEHKMRKVQKCHGNESLLHYQVTPTLARAA